MFGLFKTKPATHYRRLDDLVWLTAAVRQQQVVARARQLALDGTPTMLCTYRMASQSDLRKALGGDSNTLRLGDASRVSAANLLQWVPEGTLIRLIVAEFGATAAEDEQLLLRINDPRLTGLEVEFHASLDDPALASTPPSMREMLVRLGLKPDEPIQHRWVSRAIATARAKGRR